MRQNGQDPSTHLRIELPGSPDPAEAAAVIAAVERFLAETTPATDRAPPVNPWQRTALLEGTSAKSAFASPWGEERTWGGRPSPR